MNGKLRVLVVEDSLSVRKRIVEVLGADPELEVVGEASDGQAAIEMVRALRPDVISLDMILPVMSGLAVTEYVMAYFPTPILVVSASMNRGELFKTYDALAAGAVDVLEKPLGHEPDGDWERKLVSTLKLVARIKVITHPRASLGSLGRVRPTPNGEPGPAPQAGGHRAVALGASTGGPTALVRVLRGLPVNLAQPIFVVLHIDAPFAPALADWMNDQTPHPALYARGGERLDQLAGKVVLAPPGRHMVVKSGVVALTGEAERHHCRPSVDELFESLAQDLGPEVCAALLTGMGRDGAAGLLALRRAGAFTIAQDEATSVVYGMPREAVLLGAAHRVLPLDEIGPTLSGLLGKRGAA